MLNNVSQDPLPSFEWPENQPMNDRYEHASLAFDLKANKRLTDLWSAQSGQMLPTLGKTVGVWPRVLTKGDGYKLPMLSASTLGGFLGLPDVADLDKAPSARELKTAGRWADDVLSILDSESPSSAPLSDRLIVLLGKERPSYYDRTIYDHLNKQCTGGPSRGINPTLAKKRALDVRALVQSTVFADVTSANSSPAPADESVGSDTSVSDRIAVPHDYTRPNVDLEAADNATAVDNSQTALVATRVGDDTSVSPRTITSEINTRPNGDLEAAGATAVYWPDEN